MSARQVKTNFLRFTDLRHIPVGHYARVEQIYPCHDLWFRFADGSVEVMDTEVMEIHTFPSIKKAMHRIAPFDNDMQLLELWERMKNCPRILSECKHQAVIQVKIQDH
jgi:hypothetical protein